MHRGIALVLLVAGSQAASAPGSTPPSAALVAPSTELLKAAEARVAAADEQIKLAGAMYQRGLIPLDGMLAARRNRFQAIREAPFPTARIAEAAQAYRDDLATFFKLADTRYQAGAINQSDLATARYALAEAEFWLVQARERAGASPGDLRSTFP